MVIKTSKKPKILIFIGVHPGLKFPSIRFVQFVPRFVPRCHHYSFIISLVRSTIRCKIIETTTQFPPPPLPQQQCCKHDYILLLSSTFFLSIAYGVGGENFKSGSKCEKSDCLDYIAGLKFVIN